MFTTIKSRRDYAFILLATFGLFCFLFGCAQAPPKEADVVEEKPPEVQSITMVSEPSGEKATIEVTSSQPVPYAAFKLVQPLRIVVGITAAPSEGLTAPPVTNDTIIKDIRLETTEKDPVSTRVIATLSQDAEYTVQDQEGIVRVILFPKEPIEEKPAPVVAAKEEALGAKEPRVFFLPGKSKLNQVLGVDFFMLPQGRSRITVTTSKKAEYNLSPKDSQTLLLELKAATIRPELTRYIDSSHFKGIVEKITPIHRTAERAVDIEISLKEMAPYHVMQAEKEIRINFNKTTLEPPPKKIAQATYVKELIEPEKAPPEKPEEPKPLMAAATPPKQKPKEVARMTLEFSNADIRNILKLIGEVSQLNIVWGPEVEGTVSMRLKDVPWDQALEILLETNDLGMRKEDNVIWVTTRDKIMQLKREEEERQRAKEERLKKLKEEEEKEKVEEPLATAYITVNYAEVEDIKKLIEENVKGPRGRISVDTANKTIILTDIAANLKKAKELKDRQDKPTKQVLIEARIVEARTNFSREIGLGWDLAYEHGGSPWGGSGPGVINYDFASNFGAPGYPLNHPGSSGLMGAGITFANTAGTKVLNARIALAETEGKAKTLSSPKIITRDTKEATIKQGTTIYIPYTDTEGNRTAKEVEANLELTVTPKITPNDMVIMTINVSDDVPDYANRVGENVPINTKSANTEMMVASGDTVIIGGIYKETESESETGIPWLSKIPFIGWLFKTENVETTKTELLIFLTPTVVYSETGAPMVGG
jgi:type IV pilus assembly protein PilQ